MDTAREVVEEAVFWGQALVLVGLLFFTWYRVHALYLLARFELDEMSAVKAEVKSDVEAWIGDPGAACYHFYHKDGLIFRKDLAGYVERDNRPYYDIDIKFSERYRRASLQCLAAMIWDSSFRGGLKAAVKSIPNVRASEYEGLPEWVITEPHTTTHDLVLTQGPERMYLIREHFEGIRGSSSVKLHSGKTLQPDSLDARRYQYALRRYRDWQAKQAAG